MWCTRSAFIASVQVVGLICFLYGFFPTKVVAPGHNTFSDNQYPFSANGKPQFDKLIFVVVDALRSDFMFSSEDSSMPFVQSMIRTGEALPFTAYSSPPTVTLPRLKGFTTGGTPSFIDAILNVADDNDKSQGLSSIDSWVSQFRMQKKRNTLHFYGDDTWLKLFPPDEFFAKSEGTSSFFVSDFTEVDHNVTRHLESEIKDHSWDVLILHYLGLDHIGHKGGPKSVYMAPKQQEMDDIVKKLYNSRASDNENTLLVLMGDHGMNEIGNHGGSSAGETSPGLILASPKFKTISDGKDSPLHRSSDYQYYSSISQIDLVPTISALFGLPIPMNNFGIIMKDVLALWQDADERKSVLLENCKQFYNLMERGGSNKKSDMELQRRFHSLLECDANEETDYYSFLRDVQNSLTKSATNYSYRDIAIGFMLIMMSACASIIRIVSSSNRLRNSRFLLLSYGCFCVMYALSFHGSSLIEEEHQIWWFFSVSFVVFTFLLKPQRFWNSSICLLCIRLIRTWNNTGQKFESELTFANVLISNPSFKWVLVICTYLVPLTSFVHDYLGSLEMKSFQILTQIPDLLFMILLSVTTCISFLFKLSQTVNDGLTAPSWVTYIPLSMGDLLKGEAASDRAALQECSIKYSQFFYEGFLASLFLLTLMMRLKPSSSYSIKNFTCLLSLPLLHQTRDVNIPLFLVFALLGSCMKKNIISLKYSGSHNQVILLTFSILCLQNLSFFSIGSTNSLATVDLSNAYNGIREYNVFLVGLMTFISNFGVSIYWSFAGIEILAKISKDMIRKDKLKLLELKVFLTSAFYAVAAINLVGSCINLRFHLFIWSVFSPKLLYFLSWEFLMNIAVDGVFCAFIFYYYSFAA